MNQLQDVYGVFLYHRQNTVLELSLVTTEMPRTTAVVPIVLVPLLGHGHTLQVDNLYNSPELA
jgi:hypothetical protein